MDKVLRGLNLTYVYNVSCIASDCQKSEDSRSCHTITPLTTFVIPEVRFDLVHLDLMGPLAPCNDYAYIDTH